MSYPDAVVRELGVPCGLRRLLGTLRSPTADRAATCAKVIDDINVLFAAQVHLPGDGPGRTRYVLTALHRAGVARARVLFTGLPLVTP